MATYTDIQITVKITNGGCNIPTGTYPLNTPLHIELTPNKLYGTNGTPVLKYWYTGGSTVMAAYSQSFKKSPDTPDVWILDTELSYYECETTAMYCTLTYSYKQSYAEIKSNLTRCKTDTPDGVYPYDEITITLNADENCEFQQTPTISYYAQDKSSVPWTWKYYDFDFERVSESEYHYTFTPNTHNKIYTVAAEAVAKTIVTDKYGLIAVYKPTKDELVALSKVRFATPKLNSISVSGTVLYVVTDEYVDTAQYAISLRKMYFSIDTTIRENICLGPYNTEIECDVIGSDIIIMNMGTIIIAGQHKNLMDYNNTELQCYLPFIGFVDLKASDFMDKEITLKYEINVISGDALAVLYANGQVMQTHNCNASYPVPYRLNDRENVNTNLAPNTNYLLEEKPFIYVKSYNAAVPDSKLPYNDTKFYSQFDKVHGYTQASEIDFEVVHDFITKTEIDEIIRLLENGVFLP